MRRKRVFHTGVLLHVATISSCFRKQVKRRAPLDRTCWRSSSLSSVVQVSNEKCHEVLCVLLIASFPGSTPQLLLHSARVLKADEWSCCGLCALREWHLGTRASDNCGFGNGRKFLLLFILLFVLCCGEVWGFSFLK